MSKLPPSVRPSLLALLLVVLVAPAGAQDFASGGASRPPHARRAPDPSRAPAFYVVERGTQIRSAPSDAAPAVGALRLREGVRVLTDTLAGGLTWHEVQFGGTRGYVRAEALSNVWIRVDKSDRTMYVYRGAELVRELPADVSMSEGDKVRRASLTETEHWRIPEGVFYVTGRNARSSYYRAFVLSYPNPVHALRGLEQGIIGEAEYQAIVRADAEGTAPPMGTRLGGMIEIHGSGSGRREAWTRGCVALRDVHMDELWEYVGVGTPVVVEP
jgi:hypothetical protein